MEKTKKVLKILENMVMCLLLVGVAPLKHAYDNSIYAGQRKATIFMWEMCMEEREGCAPARPQREEREGCAPARPERQIFPGEVERDVGFFKKLVFFK